MVLNNRVGDIKYWLSSKTGWVHTLVLTSYLQGVVFDLKDFNAFPIIKRGFWLLFNFARGAFYFANYFMCQTAVCLCVFPLIYWIDTYSTQTQRCHIHLYVCNSHWFLLAFWKRSRQMFCSWSKYNNEIPPGSSGNVIRKFHTFQFPVLFLQ